MPARSESTEWITLNDFSPGIEHRLQFQGGAAAPSRQPGAATPNTWRCAALPGGGLGPLPGRSITYTPTYPQNPATTADGKLAISGFHLIGPITAGTANGVDAAEFHLAYEYVVGVQRRYRWERHRMWELVPGIDTIKTINSAEATPAHIYRPTWFHPYRAHTSDPAQPGTPVMAASWFVSGGGNEKFWSLFPAPSSSGTNSVHDISTTLAMEGLIGHQGRSVGFNLNGWTHGSPGSWSFDEQIYYTNVNLATLSSAIAATFGQENATGYAVVGSLSASELLLIKRSGGAYLIRGDIDNPTVLRLPGVISPHNHDHIGASTPIGFIYGVRDGGLWVWNGGEASELISPQLEPNFWQSPNSFVDFWGRFEQWHQYVAVPNNWLYDYAAKSWWRLDDPAVAVHFHYSQSVITPTLYCAPAQITSAAQPVVSGYSPATPASSYQWESQPIPQAMFRDVKLRQMVLVAQGQGTIAITFTGLGGVTHTETVILNGGTTPVAYRRNLNLTYTHLQVKFVANSGSSASAPIIYELRLATATDRAHIPSS